MEPAPAPTTAHQAAASPSSSGSGDGLNAVLQIPIVVEIVLGSASMTVSELAALGKGSKIPLDRKVGEPVDVVVNGRVIAHGTVVMLDDGTDRFGISLDSLASQEGQGTQGAIRSA
ncbi:MAG: flagellar motor switch protein FliN [Rhodobacteraceae bacterium]|nr:flagellar motor switch protein FliN [Paracoccaceae bacterium]